MATWAAQSVCSSGGIFWMASSVLELVQPKWVWASHMPGIRVAPAPSITVTPVVATLRDPRPTRAMRLPWIRTSPW